MRWSESNLEVVLVLWVGGGTRAGLTPVRRGPGRLMTRSESGPIVRLAIDPLCRRALSLTSARRGPGRLVTHSESGSVTRLA